MQTKQAIDSLICICKMSKLINASKQNQFTQMMTTIPHVHLLCPLLFNHQCFTQQPLGLRQPSQCDWWDNHWSDFSWNFVIF